MAEATGWSGEFRERAARRASAPQPEWWAGCRLDPAIARSMQKFQVGESGDGRHLIANARAAGDPDYETAVELFVAEEQHHARMLEQLLHAGGIETKRSHWSDSVFVHVRRLMGLRLELMVLTIAEVVALRYYRALADGGRDALLIEVAEGILDDERQHVPFQCRRLRIGFQATPPPARRVVRELWRVMAAVVIVVVAVDHGPALRACGVSRRAFITDTVQIFHGVLDTVFAPDRCGS